MRTDVGPTAGAIRIGQCAYLAFLPGCMPNAIAFFPWAYIDEPRTIGPLRLIPYEKGSLPGDQPNVAQADLDGVFAAYANRPNSPVERGAMLELGEWMSGQDAAQATVSALFRARNIVAFSALSQRRLFGQHLGYCNYDAYTLVVQRYLPGETGTFAFDTRRRDGRTNQLWGSDEFAFHRPNHVDGNSRMSLDEPLLTALLELPADHRAYEAIVEFCSANTDSRDVPEHVELVMCKSALEWLFGIGSNAKALVDAIAQLLSGIEALPATGPLLDKWKARWPDETRPLHAWAKDFCAVRGTSAHGQSRERTHFVWQDHQHLAFLALLFPLLVKKVLADEGRMQLDAFDLERLRRLDSFLASDPFFHDWRNHKTSHPWEAISSRALIASRAHLFYPGLA